MNVQVTLSEADSFKDLLQWNLRNSGRLNFRVTRSSSFGLLTEAQAVIKLHELRKAGISIAVECTYDLSSALEKPEDLGLFHSLFGIALLSEAETVADRSGANVREPLLSALWNYLIERKGDIGDGTGRAIICRDPDMPVPRCIQEPDSPGFPSRDSFKRFLTTTARNLGAGQFGKSEREDRVTSFLYESAFNSFEHGRFDSAGRPFRTIRGMVLEKRIFRGAEAFAARSGIPAHLREYGRKIWRGDKDREMILFSFSVLDCGVGIHNTLPRLEGESSWERLKRAFSPGQSRKAQVGGIGRGEGLAKIAAACSDLRAFLFVQSAELMGFADFSDRSSDLGGIDLLPYGEDCPCKLGTSLSLVWLAPAEGGARPSARDESQISLF